MAAHPIALDDLARLAIDDGNGRLFWDGKEVLTVLSLRWYVEVAIIVGAVAAAIAAVWPIVRFFLGGG